MSNRILEESRGYKSLRAAVDKNIKEDHCHDYASKLSWIVERARHYGDKLGIDPADILDSWEERRDYWYMNYYQDADMPRITSDNVRVFETTADLVQSVGKTGFRCPACGGVSSNPYECNSGLKNKEGKVCDWKSFGLFGCLGKGTFIYLKEKLAGQTIFTPVAWEGEASNGRQK